MEDGQPYPCILPSAPISCLPPSVSPGPASHPTSVTTPPLTLTFHPISPPPHYYPTDTTTTSTAFHDSLPPSAPLIFPSCCPSHPLLLLLTMRSSTFAGLSLLLLSVLLTSLPTPTSAALWSCQWNWPLQSSLFNTESMYGTLTYDDGHSYNSTFSNGSTRTGGSRVTSLKGYRILYNNGVAGFGKTNNTYNLSLLALGADTLYKNDNLVWRLPPYLSTYSGLTIVGGLGLASTQATSGTGSNLTIAYSATTSSYCEDSFQLSLVACSAFTLFSCQVMNFSSSSAAPSSSAVSSVRRPLVLGLQLLSHQLVELQLVGPLVLGFVLLGLGLRLRGRLVQRPRVLLGVVLGSVLLRCLLLCGGHLHPGHPGDLLLRRCHQRRHPLLFCCRLLVRCCLLLGCPVRGVLRGRHVRHHCGHSVYRRGGVLLGGGLRVELLPQRG